MTGVKQGDDKSHRTQKFHFILKNNALAVVRYPFSVVEKKDWAVRSTVRFWAADQATEGKTMSA